MLDGLLLSLIHLREGDERPAQLDIEVALFLGPMNF